MFINRYAKPAALAAALVLLLATATSAQTAPPQKQSRQPAPEQKQSFDPTVFVLREFLYSDKTLDQMLEFSGAERGTYKDAFALVKAGDAPGALKLLDGMASRPETAADADYWLVVAKARRVAGDAGGAKQAVRRLFTLPDVETRMELLAWSLLRELGEQPPAASADEVLGVVAEIAIDAGVMVVAAYRDGDSRVFWSTGGGVIGTPPDERIVGAAKEVTRVAGPLARQLARTDSRPLPAVSRVRFTLLTPGGMRAGEEEQKAAESTANKFSDLYLAVSRLMLMRLRDYQQQQGKPSAKKKSG